MIYHLVVLGGGETTGLFAFAYSSTEVQDTIAFNQRINAQLGFADMYHSPSTQYFTTDAPTVQSVIDYDSYFEQFDFLPRWEEFLARMHEWQKVPLVIDGQTFAV